jgi:hypothetical protein
MGESHGAIALFVATDLDSFEAPADAPYAADVTICGRAYRRLDPAYYAWLRRLMGAAKRAFEAKRLAPAAFDAIRTAFNAVHAWAVRHLGEAVLVDTARSFDATTYEPPRPDDDLPGSGARLRPTAPRRPSGHVHPGGGDWPFTEHVTADAVAKVDAVRDEALALGWTEAALYRNRGTLRFPYGGDWGLVCFVVGDASIGPVTREAIEVRPARGAPHRFCNPNVPQPWRRAAEEVCT